MTYQPGLFPVGYNIKIDIEIIRLSHKTKILLSKWIISFAKANGPWFFIRKNSEKQSGMDSFLYFKKLPPTCS